MFRKTMIILAMLAVLPVFPSCFDEPVTPIKEPPPVEIPWPDMTSEGDVIKTIVLCYEYPKDSESLSKYSALLHSQYFFKLHEDDTMPSDSPLMMRSEDLASTEWLFRELTMLEFLIVEPGPWYELSEIEEEPCDGCYETMRQYFIRVQFGRDGTIFQCRPGSAFVTIVIAPDESDSSKWVIRAIYDLGT